MASKHLIHRRHHVTTGRRRHNKHVAMKAHQAHIYHHTRQLVTDVMTPSPNVNSLVNGNQIKYFLEEDTLKNVESVVLRFKIKMTGADDELAPVPYWFDRVEIYDRKSGEEIGRLYSDALYTLLNLIEQEHINNWKDLINYDSKTYTESRKVHAVNNEEYYYLPLVASVFEGMHLDMTSIKGDIEFRLHPRNPVINGTGTPELLEVAGLYETDMTDSQSDHAYRQFLKAHVPVHQYLDSQQYIETGIVMNASTKYEFNLDQFNHASACLLAVIRPANVSNINNNYQNYVDLYNGSIDLVSTTGESIYGKGRAIPANYLRKIIAPQYVESEMFEHAAIYPLIFGDLQKAAVGSIEGYFRFNGEKNRIAITTPANGTNASLTLAQSAVADGGSIAFFYKGDHTNVAYNATTAQIEQAINALSSVRKERLVCSAVDDFADANDVVLTLTKKNGQAKKLDEPIKYVSQLTNAGSPITITPTVVSGQDGWSNGTFDVSIYSLYFKHVNQHNGRLEVKDWA